MQMEKIPTYQEFLTESLNEATTSWSVMMKGVKSGGPGPWSIVAIEYNKVVDQDLVPVRDAIPAHYESMRTKHSRSRIRIEDSEGKVVFEK
jgi:hypothetical protein